MCLFFSFTKKRTKIQKKNDICKFFVIFFCCGSKIVKKTILQSAFRLLFDSRMFDDCGEAYRAVIALANDKDERSVGNESSMECRIWCRCKVYGAGSYSHVGDTGCMLFRQRRVLKRIILSP